ncbi:hypothetical protein BK004_03835 [bacterium CG10_46_32]|nr:MAG: hypothetical protein BK004_03835 [bacterium CG10_46_32]PIR55876.1 MAG: hypothetical protein COU73_03860 [Parcubacteria group bacterium CG10_big_fil_rev_8_21_14_0_10_46_32]
MSSKRAIGIACVGLVLDRTLKYLAQTTPEYTEGVFTANHALGFKLHVNTVFAWSLPISNTVALWFALAVMAGLVIVLFKKRAHPEWTGLWLVLAGAISNIADRVLYGGVIDYIVIPFSGVVNVADLLIIVGVGLLVFPRKAYAH